MALTDRILPLCELLLGAAYADDDFKDREEEAVRGLLQDLAGGELSIELETKLNSFDPKTFDFDAAAAHFQGDPEDDRKRVVVLVAAINDADDEIDFAEDEYLRKLAKALALPDGSLAGMTIDVEDVEELRDNFEKVRKGPPPPPSSKKQDGSVDVDL